MELNEVFRKTIVGYNYNKYLTHVCKKKIALASLTKYSFLEWNIYRIFYITRQMDYSENLTGTCYLESLRRQVLITVTKMADVTLHFQNQSQIMLAFSFKCFLDRYV